MEQLQPVGMRGQILQIRIFYQPIKLALGRGGRGQQQKKKDGDSPEEE